MNTQYITKDPPTSQLTDRRVLNSVETTGCRDGFGRAAPVLLSSAATAFSFFFSFSFVSFHSSGSYSQIRTCMHGVRGSD
ncbi:hypothetical protein EYF80_033389 [Liparis tanakae]|uniref:Uncharacterized protein n=1 Tax=Liparis tanakae TaxID=230148 RepID=A0A4Z2GRZ1_9TELE|nr:hypothetical protein EYF80_033389 [Liparis tanakae]